MPTLPDADRLTQIVRGLQSDLTTASIALWRVLASIEPELLAAQSALGWSEEQAARWLAGEVSEMENPSDWAGHVQGWLGLLRRTGLGFVG